MTAVRSNNTTGTAGELQKTAGNDGWLRGRYQKISPQCRQHILISIYLISRYDGEGNKKDAKKMQDTSGVHVWLVLTKAFHTLKAHAEKSLNLSRAGLGDSDFRVLEALLHKGALPVNTIGPNTDDRRVRLDRDRRSRRNLPGFPASAPRSLERVALEIDRKPGAGGSELTLGSGERDSFGGGALLERQAAEVSVLQ